MTLAILVMGARPSTPAQISPKDAAIKSVLTGTGADRIRKDRRAGRSMGASTMSETSKTTRRAPRAKPAAKGWPEVRAFLREHPQSIRDDADLLSDLGLWIKADNIVEFGPAALARLSAAKTRENAARRELEATARANFAAQAQTHAAVVDLLEARNHADL